MELLGKPGIQTSQNGLLISSGMAHLVMTLPLWESGKCIKILKRVFRNYANDEKFDMVVLKMIKYGLKVLNSKFFINLYGLMNLIY